MNTLERVFDVVASAAILGLLILLTLTIGGLWRQILNFIY